MNTARISRAALALALAPGLALAAPITVRGGEHGDKTRLVIDAPRGAALQWGVAGEALVILLSAHEDGFNTAGARGRGLKRVRGVAAAEAASGSALRVEMGCACGVKQMTLKDGRLVFDIAARGPRPAAPFLGAAATADAAAPTPAVKLDAKPAAPALPPPPARIAPPAATPPAETEPAETEAAETETTEMEASEAQPAANPVDIAAAMAQAAAQLQKLAAQREAAAHEAAPAPQAEATPDAPPAIAPAPVEPVEAEPLHHGPAHAEAAPPAEPDAQEHAAASAPDAGHADAAHDAPVDEKPGHEKPAHAEAAQAEPGHAAPAAAPHADAAADAAHDPHAAPAHAEAAHDAGPHADAHAGQAAAEDPVAIARQRLLKQLAAAASEGLLNPRDRDAAEEIADHPELAEVVEALQSLPLKVRTGIEIAREAAEERRRREPLPDNCLPDAALDIAAWAKTAPAALQMGAARRKLVGEFDQPDDDAVLAYARLLVHFGFGAEASRAIDAFSPDDPQPALRDLAALIEHRDPPQDGPLRDGLDCVGFHFAWAQTIAAAEGRLEIGEIDIDRLRPSISRLPDRLRSVMVAPLAQRALDAGDVSKAEALTGLAALTEPDLPESPGWLLLLRARLDAARGEWRRAERKLAPLIALDSPVGVEARLELVEQRLSRGAAPPRGFAEDMEALAFTQGQSPLARKLYAAAAQSRAKTDGLAPALASLHDLAERGGDLDAARASARTMLEEFEPEGMDPANYAEIALAAWDLVGDGPDGDPARVAVAGRLRGFGLGRLAEDLLAPALSRGDAAARIAAAEAATEAGFPDDALRHLAALDTAPAERARAAAEAARGDFEAAAAAAQRAGADDLAARYGWLAGDWRLAAAAGEADKRILARWMSGDGDPPAELAALAQDDSGLQERLWAFSSASESTAERDEKDLIDAASRALQAARRQRELMGELLQDG